MWASGPAAPRFSRALRPAVRRASIEKFGKTGFVRGPLAPTNSLRYLRYDRSDRYDRTGGSFAMLGGNPCRSSIKAARVPGVQALACFPGWTILAPFRTKSGGRQMMKSSDFVMIETGK